MLSAYAEGRDLHTLTAQSLTGREDVNKDDRKLAKAVNFGLLYGMGAKGLQSYALKSYGVQMSLDQAALYRKRFFKTYPGLERRHDNERRAWHRGETETRTLTGRRRMDVQRLTDRLNAPVQGTGADGLKVHTSCSNYLLSFSYLWRSFKYCSLLTSELRSSCTHEVEYRLWEGRDIVYWFMRMKQGSEGKDFTSELWNQKLIGIMFGTWTIHHVSDGAGGIDERKLTLEHLSNYRPIGELVFKKNWLDTSRRFLIEMVASDKVVVEFDGSLHIATVTDEFEEDPNRSHRDYGEHFKCRRISDPKEPFPLEKLPSSYRLISSTGRGAVQKINAYKPLVEMLDRYDSPKAVAEACNKMPTEQLLEILSPKQWEAICAEYLRHTEEVRPLLLAVGSTLKTIDIYGVNRDGKRVLAQCKNDAKARDAQTIIEWLDTLVADPDDILYFFARKGAKEGVPESKCRIVDDTEILRWLRLPSQKDYETYLKTL